MLLLVQSSLVELAVEIAVAGSNMPLASSSLCRCCPLSMHPTLPALLGSYNTQTLLFLLLLLSACSGCVSLLHLSHIWESTILARPPLPAIQYTKEQHLHASISCRKIHIISVKKLLDASVTNAVGTVQPPKCLQRHTHSYEEGKLQKVISFPAEFCN